MVRLERRHGFCTWARLRSTQRHADPQGCGDEETAMDMCGVLLGASARHWTVRTRVASLYKLAAEPGAAGQRAVDGPNRAVVLECGRLADLISGAATEEARHPPSRSA
jgi:hypothetical protein